MTTEAPERHEPGPSGPGNGFAPNHYSLPRRLSHGALAVFLLAYGGIGLYRDDIHLPGRWGDGFHFHGPAAWLMFGAILTAAAVFLALVIDHYDRRNNEHRYVLFKRGANLLGWVFFAAAMAWHLAEAIGRVARRF